MTYPAPCYSLNEAVHEFHHWNVPYDPYIISGNKMIHRRQKYTETDYYYTYDMKVSCDTGAPNQNEFWYYTPVIIER